MFEAVPDSAPGVRFTTAIKEENIFFSRIFPGYDRFAFDVAIHVLVAKVLVTKWHLAETTAFSPKHEISSEVHWSQSSIFRVFFSSKIIQYDIDDIDSVKYRVIFTIFWKKLFLQKITIFLNSSQPNS
jgi:hypothetical protein